MHVNYRFAISLGAFILALVVFATRSISSGWAFFVTLTLVLGAGMLTTWLVDEQISLLGRLIRRSAQGNLDTPLPYFDDGPLGDLRHAADALRAQLTSRLDEVKREQERLQVVLSEMHEGVALVRNGTIELANPSFGELLGTAHSLTQKPLIEATRIPELAEALWTATVEKRSVERDLFVGSRELHISVYPLAQAQKQALIVLLDITELRRLDQLRREFVTNASHELRTPVAAVLGAAETLASGASEDPKARASFVDILLRHGKRLSQLTQDLLDLARLEAGYRPQRENVAVAVALQNVLALLTPIAAQKGVGLTSDVSDSLICVADQAAVEQILTNLIQNAIQYTPKGGTIHVAGQTNGTNTRFWVQDNGPGIPKPHQARLFERFYRVDQARSRELGGTGLGLAIVKHLALAYDGNVELQSEAGKGAKFTVSFPRVIDEEQ